MNFSEIDLPVSLYLKKITETLFEKGAMILIAAPGAGKSTLVPCAILNALKNSNEKILLVQPRRVAARSVTDRIADLLGERIGERAGLRTRTETIVSKETRIEVVTDGVLVRILQHDPSLEGFSVVMFDEFHERSIQADLSLAFLWDLRRSIRKDLKVIFMSATPDSRRIIETLGDMPIIDVPGKTFPVETEYRAVHDEKKSVNLRRHLRYHFFRGLTVTFWFFFRDGVRLSARKLRLEKKIPICRLRLFLCTDQYLPIYRNGLFRKEIRRNGE